MKHYSTNTLNKQGALSFSYQSVRGFIVPGLECLWSFPVCSVMCKSSAGPGRNKAIWKLSVSAPCQPATRYPPPSRPVKHPLWNPNGCQFLRQPTADPFRPGNCRPAKEPKSPAASIPLPPPQTLRWLCWLLIQAWERKAERHRKRARKGRKKESAQVCIFNLIASSLHFAPRLKRPLTPLFALDFFFNMTRIPPACVHSRRHYRRHKPCSRQPCVLTVDFESESA